MCLRKATLNIYENMLFVKRNWFRKDVGDPFAWAVSDETKLSILHAKSPAGGKWLVNSNVYGIKHNTHPQNIVSITEIYLWMTYINVSI